MADLLRKAQLPDLSYYQTNGKASEPLSKKRDRQDSTVSTEGTPLGTDHDVGAERLESSAQRVAPEPRTSETTFQQPSQYALDREENGTSSLVTAPMGSLYEVTQLSDIQTTSPRRQRGDGVRLIVKPAYPRDGFSAADLRRRRWLWL